MRSSFRDLLRPDARTSGSLGYAQQNSPRDMHLPPGQAGFTGSKTMRRLSEPLQRDPEDVDPVSTSIIGGGDMVLLQLEREAEMYEQMKNDEPMDAAVQTERALEGGPEETDIDVQFLQSMLETNPEKVIRALVEFLKMRQK